jgi:3-hydroxyisobutyrate dehydrogenase-like beta-hydroxyacid dehydrogenase
MQKLVHDCSIFYVTALSEKLYVIKGGCGAASSVKMVNQLLAGVHIASAAEAMAFGARLNLRTRRLFEIIQHARGYSWYVPLVMSLHFDHTHFSILQMCYCGQKMAQGES